MKQQQVHIIGLRAEGYKAIKSVLLTPDLFAGKVVKVVGEVGAGKSSLTELIQISLSGSDAIAKKDSLASGFVTEVQILDGDHKLFMGVRIREIMKGENKGQPVFETFLFEKDADGKPYVPVIDGRKATAVDYMNMLHTDITFNMPVLFSNNQTEHRKLLEKLFKDELTKLGIEAVLERIEQAKKRQDNTRAICEANGAFRTTFEEEGWKIEDLALLQRIDVEQVRAAITEKEIERDRLVRSSSEKVELELTKLKSEKDAALREIQAKVTAVTEKIRELNERKMAEYGKLKATSDKWQLSFSEVILSFSNVDSDIDGFPIDATAKVAIHDIVSKQKEKQITELGKEPEVPTEPKIIAIIGGVPQVANPERPTWHEDYVPLVDERFKLVSEYRDLSCKELATITPESVDTTSIDSKITELKVRRDAAEKTNALVARYGYWETWIEAKGIYEKEIDTLRKLYSKVNTGVAGMIIEPLPTSTGRIEIWLKYDGSYDTDFFGNAEKEQRFLFDYSNFQRSIIGLLLQASRLDLKSKALRMTFIDDISVTKKSIEMIEKVCDEFDLKLWTSFAKDDYDTDNIPEGEIIVEGGEIFF